MIKKQYLKFVFFSIISLYIILFFFFAYNKHLNLTYGLELDNALNFQAIHNTLEGNFLIQTITHPHFLLNGHINLISFLILPIYKLIPTYFLLIFLQTFIISLGSIPVYLITKHILKNKLYGFIIAGIYLLNPVVQSLILSGFRYETFAMTFLLTTVYFFIKKDFKLFTFFLIASMLIKENIILVTILLGIYAIFLKREFKWILTPIILGLFFLFLMNGTLLDKNKSYEDSITIQMYYKHGETISKNINYYSLNKQELIKEIKTNIRNINSTHILFGGPQILSVLHPITLIMGIPSTLQLVLLPEPFFDFNSPLVFTHDNRFLTTISFSIIISFILGINFLFKLLEKIQLKQTDKIKACIMIMILIWQIIFSLEIFVQQKEYYYSPTPTYNYRAFLEQIPSNASVSAHASIVSIFSERENNIIFNKYPDKDLEYDYLIINYKDLTWKPWDENYKDRINFFINNSNWKIIVNQEPYILLKNNRFLENK